MLLGMAIVAIGLALALVALRQADAGAVIGAVITVEALFDVFACIYLARLISSDGRLRLWVLLLLLTTAMMSTVGIVAIGFVAARAFVGLPPLDAHLGLLIVGMGLVISGAAPITKALVIFLARRDTSEG